MNNINFKLSNFLDDDEFSFLQDKKEIYKDDLFFWDSNFQP